MQTDIKRYNSEYNLEHTISLNNFVKIYNKSVGIICKEYIGKHLVIYDDNYDVVNSLSNVEEPHKVTELYIDGLVITNNEIFETFEKLEHVHGIPILKINYMSRMFLAHRSLISVSDLGKWDVQICVLCSLIANL